MLSQHLLETLSLLFNQKISKFPGALPTSVNSNNVELIAKGYVSALKADGDRVFGFLNKDKLVFVWRDMKYKTLTLPCSFTGCYIFDGELLPKQNLFLIFDVLLYNNEPAIRLDHLQRIELANHFICTQTPENQRHTYQNTIVKDDTIAPLPTNYEWGVTWHCENVIRMQVNPRYAREDVALLWEKRHSLPYGCDGVIFTRLWCCYKPFTEDVQAILKWKPCVTIDFLVQACCEKKEHSIVVGKHVPEKDFRTFIHTADARKRNCLLATLVNMTTTVFSSCVLPPQILDVCKDQICEFAWDDTAHIWIWQRLRMDKTLPNTLNTVLACVTSITDQITVEAIANL